MMKRLCFLSPDVGHARKVVADLRAAGIPPARIYVVAKTGTDLEDLPDAGPEDNDFMGAYERGIALGGIVGTLAGLLAVAFPAPGLVLGGGAMLLFELAGAGLGGFMTGLAGASFSSSRLQQYEADLDAGKILVLADVPKDAVPRFEDLIRKHDPSIDVLGVEPPAPIIP